MRKFKNYESPDLDEDFLNNDLGKKLVYISNTEPTGNNREKLWIRKSPNLLEKKIYRMGYYDNSGNFTYAQSIVTYKRIYIKGTIYIQGTSVESASCRITEFSSSDTFIKRTIALNSSLQLDPNTAYIYVSVDHSDTKRIDNLMISSGNTQKTYVSYYEPYIYQLNDNNIYETIPRDNFAQIIGTHLAYNNTETTYNIRTEIHNNDKFVSIRLYSDSLKQISQGNTNYTLLILPPELRLGIELRQTIITTSGGRLEIVIKTDGSVQIATAYTAINAGDKLRWNINYGL